jgi:CDGSH-type Zn-finger protein
MAVKISVRPNGPVLVEGECEVYDSAGKKLDTAGKPSIALCRCGSSNNKPFCDGTHNKVGFKAS